VAAAADTSSLLGKPQQALSVANATEGEESMANYIELKKLLQDKLAAILPVAA
jgi:hypothetical protein